MKAIRWTPETEPSLIYPMSEEKIYIGTCDGSYIGDYRAGTLTAAGFSMPEPIGGDPGVSEGFVRVRADKRRGKRRTLLLDAKGHKVMQSDAPYLSGVYAGCCVEQIDRSHIRLIYGFKENAQESWLKEKDIRVWGEIDLPKEWQGEMMIPYHRERLLSDNDKGLICLNTGMVGPVRWRRAAASRCCRARVEDRHGVTFVDEELRPMPDRKGGVRYFRAAQHFSEDVCAVDNGHGRWSYIDLYGETAFPGSFEYALSMNGGVALVMTGGKWNAVDKAGILLAGNGWDGLCFPAGQKEHLLVDKTRINRFTGREETARYLVSRASLRP